MHLYVPDLEKFKVWTPPRRRRSMPNEQQRWSSEVLIASKLFARVILEDSSQIKLPKGNHEDFPAHGKQVSKDTLIRCDWHVIVTNVQAEVMNADNLFE
ncbi:MAG: hypothetical protein P1U87_20865 [Verrucomicrobiales bacterium]|nr:hypothetical protein [Verrucomicrobiales bacterium]